MPALQTLTPEITTDLHESVDRVMSTHNPQKQLMYLLVCLQRNMIMERQIREIEGFGKIVTDEKLTSAEVSALNADMQFPRTKGNIKEHISRAFFKNAELVLRLNALCIQNNLPPIKTYTSKSFKG